MRTIASAMTLALAVSPLGAQAPGTMAPELEWAKTYGFDGMPKEQLAELKGSVVLLEFWGTR